MSDPTPDPHDDLLRAALRAEAEGVQAGEELRQRIDAEVARSPRRPVPWLIAAAAVLALVLGIGVVTLRGDDADQTVDVVDDPTTTTTATGVDVGAAFALLAARDCAAGTVQLVVLADPAATQGQLDAIAAALSAATGPGTLTSVSPGEVLTRVQSEGEVPDDVTVAQTPTAWVATYTDPELELQTRAAVSDLPGVGTTSSTDCRDEVAAPDRPDTIVLVREDGWLVVVGPDGAQRELFFGGDPAAPPAGQEEGGPQFIDSVTLTPDGRWVYFSTCCEPASGVTFRIPIDGGEPEQVALGAYPAISPDGRWLATATGEAISVSPIDGDDVLSSFDVGCCARGLTWSPDGSALAFTIGIEADAEPQVQRLAWDGTALTPVDSGKPDNPGWFATWLPDGTPNTVSGEPVADDRSLNQDRTYEWSLWVDQDGTLLGQGPGVAGDRIPLEGLPPALVADW
jgi:hypothetical protein